MQAITLDLNKSVCGNSKSVINTDIQFSLRPFISFITERIQTEKSAKINFYKYLLAQFEVYPELMHPINEQDTAKYQQLFELLYTALCPLLNDELEQYWAISKPISPCFYYGTDAFYQILLTDKANKLRPGLTLPSKADIEKSTLNNFYNIILQRFYNFTLGGANYTIKSLVDRKTHLVKYYRLNIDNRFLDVKSKGPLPELTLQNVKEYMKNEEDNLDILRNLLPPDKFEIEGLSIITFTDVTSDYALESIKNAIIEHHQCRADWSSSKIVSALKSLVETDLIDFGLLPYITLNSRTIVHNHDGFESVIIQQAMESGMEEEVFTSMTDDFINHPRRMIFPEINVEEYSTYPMLKLLIDKGIKSYALFPLFYNAKLVGCLELYSKDINAFNGNSLPKIEAALPLLAQLFQNIITDFNFEIMGVVTDKFTTLQSSVQWRFYLAAYNYLKSGALQKNLPIERILFKDVHPFYGAVDIRNSSIERNLMIRKDLYAHFELLETMLKNLKAKVSLDIENDFAKQKSDLKGRGFEDLSDREILKTDDYLQRQLPSYLNLLKSARPETADLIDAYFDLSKEGGEIYRNRDNYELSMQMINHAVSRHLEEFNAELQEVYPSYFEKFRTDGVEFDIYLGQSIAPEIKLTEETIRDFRYRQLKVIAEIGRTTANLKEHLPLPLETTQLIFVYQKLIDISFRIDEQRFDVEGSYNIRYQMVKKRIDKAHIKGSTERLTQPGRIAIVYFDSDAAREYLGYIKRLQAERRLTDLVEYVEVEELQGVEGLKALRVEIARI